MDIPMNTVELVGPYNINIKKITDRSERSAVVLNKKTNKDPESSRYNHQDTSRATIKTIKQLANAYENNGLNLSSSAPFKRESHDNTKEENTKNLSGHLTGFETVTAQKPAENDENMLITHREND